MFSEFWSSYWTLLDGATSTSKGICYICSYTDILFSFQEVTEAVAEEWR